MSGGSGATSTEAAAVSGKFWLDRELHPSHLSDKTRESKEDRRLLIETLDELRESTASATGDRREATA